MHLACRYSNVEMCSVNALQFRVICECAAIVKFQSHNFRCLFALVLQFFCICSSDVGVRVHMPALSSRLGLKWPIN